jgi:hypothetical protein
MDINEQENRIKALFEQARGLTYEPSPYLETRVLAELRERKHRHSSLLFWKQVALAASTACLALFIYVTFFTGNGAYNAQVNQAVAVRIELVKTLSSEIALAQIDLPEGVRFYSRRHPELQDQRQLTVAWESLKGKSHLPFVVKADTAGIRTVRVSFYDRNHVVVTTKTLKINFS